MKKRPEIYLFAENSKEIATKTLIMHNIPLFTDLGEHIPCMYATMCDFAQAD